MKRFALSILAASVAAIAIVPVAYAVDFDQLRQENLEKDAANFDRVRRENLEKSNAVDFDQLRQENLEKDAVNFDRVRRENLEKSNAVDFDQLRQEIGVDRAGGGVVNDRQLEGHAPRVPRSARDKRAVVWLHCR